MTTFTFSIMAKMLFYLSVAEFLVQLLEEGLIWIINIFVIWKFDFQISVRWCEKKNIHKNWCFSLALSWRGPLSYRNQSIDLQSKSMDWFLYDNGLRHERVKWGSEQTVESYNEKVDRRISASIHLGEDLLKTSSRRLRRPKIVTLHYDKNRQPFCDLTIFWFIF